jgi:hypothetical protein
MAVTLLQAALDQRMGMNPREGTLIQMFDYVNPIINSAPAEAIDGFWDDYEQVNTLPTVQWRALNEAFSESSGTTKTLREYVKLIGGEVKIDVELLNGPKGETTKRRQTEMKVLAASNELTRALFEGSESNNVREMVGLRDRIDSNQLIENASGGGALTLAKLRDLRDAVPFSRRQQPGYKRGEGVKLQMYMNPYLRNKIDDLINASTGARQIQVAKDEFGRRVEMWDDVEIVVMRQSGAAMLDTSQLLWFDEDNGSGSPTCASIYLVAWGDDMTRLLYRRPSNDGRMLRVFERPEMESEPRYLLRFSGAFGLEVQHPLAAARLYHITQA